MLPLISSLVYLSLCIVSILFVFRTHPAINLPENLLLRFLFFFYRTVFSYSLTCLGLFLQLLPLSVSPIGWSLTPIISFFLFILTTLALLSWIPESASHPLFFMLRYLAFHTFCLFIELGLNFVGLYLSYLFTSVSVALSWFLIFKFLLLLRWSAMLIANSICHDPDPDLKHIPTFTFIPSFICKRLQHVQHTKPVSFMPI